MSVIANAEVPVFQLPGLTHQTLASHRQELHHIEIWMQTIAPETATPVHRHPCKEVIVVLQGSGRLILGETEQDFGANTTLIIPADVVHQVVNTGSEPMSIIAVLEMTPTETTTPEGQPVALPWQGT